MGSCYSRRRFLELGAGAAGMFLIQRSPFAEIARAQPTHLVRRNLEGLSAGHEIIRSFELAIARMKALPPTDPRSFAYQAAIHGTHRRGRPDSGWNSCVHGSELFWPWHRMYLYFFERIVREMSGNPNWALPFWDWTTQRKLPAMFRRRTSPLFVPQRNPAMNSGAGEIAQSEVELRSRPGGDPNFLDQPDYIRARVAMEYGPHSMVHVRVGGWMWDAPTAAQDPIFWVHHANVDRLWNRWLAEHDRLNLSADQELSTKGFIFFDEHRNRVRLNACELIRSTAELGYSYEGERPRVKQGCRPAEPRVPARETLSRSPQSFVVGRKRATISLPIEGMEDKLRALARNRRATLLLSLENVAAPRQPGTVWQVFLGRPQGTRPHPRSPHFIGHLSLFGTGVRASSIHHFQPARFTFPVDSAIAAVLKRAQGRTIPLEFVPTGSLVNGKRASPRVAANVSVGGARLLAETRRPRR